MSELPELPNEDLQDTIFGHLLGLVDTDKIKFERIHSIRKPVELPGETPRDARFHNYKDKEQIWVKLRTTRRVYITDIHRYGTQDPHIEKAAEALA